MAMDIHFTQRLTLHARGIGSKFNFMHTTNAVTLTRINVCRSLIVIVRKLSGQNTEGAKVLWVIHLSVIYVLVNEQKSRFIY